MVAQLHTCTWNLYILHTFDQLESKSVKINKIENSLFPLHSVCIAYQEKEFHANSLFHATLQATFLVKTGIDI